MPNLTLRAHLRPVKRRLWMNLGVQYGLTSLSLGLLAACAWMVMARIFPITDYRIWACASCTAFLGMGCIWFYRNRPGDAAAAKWLDRNGLDDRVLTALQSEDQTTVFAVLLREDAEQAVSSFVSKDLKSRLKVRIGAIHWVSASSLLAAFVLMLFIPNQMDTYLANRHKQQEWMEKQSKQVEAWKEDWNKKPSDLLESKEIGEALQILQDKLDHTKLSIEALHEMEQAMKKLDASIAKLEKKQLQSKQWAESWQRTEALRQIGQAFQSRQSDRIRSAVSQAGERIARMTPQQKQQLASELERLASAAAAPTQEEEQQLRTQLKQAAAALRGSGKADAALEELGAALATAGADAEALAQEQSQAAALAAKMAANALPEARELAASGGQPGAAWDAGGLAERLAAGAGAGAQAGGAGAQAGVAGAGAGAQASGAGAGAQAGGAGAGAGAQAGGAGAGAQAGGVGAGTGAQAGGAGAGVGAQAGGAGAGAGAQASGAGAGAGAQAGGAGAGAQAGGVGAGTGAQAGGAGAGVGAQAGGAGAGAGAQASGAGGTQGGFGAGTRGLVSTPRERSGSGSTYVDGGPLSSGGHGSQISAGESAPAMDGASRPYEDVYAEYEAEASQSMNRSDLPQQVQSLVRDYFWRYSHNDNSLENG
ncbi:coiled-coil domain-containing protein [Paenibacillus hexagrammi]|uniref:Phage tail tape measure protein n=1 Tax=Paenibacillus hexagrammi TaxID=2908839 RepID=A0ABY3SPV8_9BACL|nr:hypothetical protein [Paenibacillus sp. YPD9-1]UJF35101.1 hypothetical protein L0M14_08190 [Paenibacillus sp. YPD9-1]